MVCELNKLPIIPHKRIRLRAHSDSPNRVVEQVQEKNVKKSPTILKLKFKGFIMNKSIRTGLIGLAILVGLLIFILLINLHYSYPKTVDTQCLKLSGQNTCQSTDNDPYRYYGTKTSYHVVLSNDTDLLYGDCGPQLFYLYSRHATRYPDKENIEEMETDLPILRDKILASCAKNECRLCEDDINKLKLWKLNMVPDDDNRITKTGEQEAADLALRYRNKFPMLLDRSYSTDSFTFEYTSRTRTFETAKSFAKGLFGKKRMESINLSGNINDHLLQFHKDCKDYVKHCNDKTADHKQIKKFENGPILTLMTSSVSERLGVDLNFTDVKLMYRACSFGYAQKDDTSWCSVFSTSDLKVFEFYADIDDYYKDGYGNELNFEQACPTVKHLVETVRNSTAGPYKRAVLLFSHAGAMKKIYARFGLFKDNDQITADGICSQQDRQWRSTFIAPFNTNIAFVLFLCGRDYKIAAFHNEKPIIIGGCKDLLCPIETFYATYNPIAENCDIKSKCCSCCSN